MVFGVSTACMYPKNLELVIQQYGESGIRDIEIFFNTFSELTPDYVRGIEQQLRQYGIRVHAVHPFTSGIEPLMLFSEYERRMGDMLDFYRRFFEIMQRFDTRIFVFHGDHKASANTAELYAQRYSYLRDAALPYGVVVAQENISRCKSGDLSFLTELSQLLKDEISFVFDIKQALRSGLEPMEVLRVMDRRVVHIHANDHTAGRDCLLPGKGNFDFCGLYTFLKEKKIAPSTMIEVYRSDFKEESELRKSLEFMSEFCKI